MKKKGFTLIELIAVLVILAIIALIVTPLVLNIINKARTSANKRSVDAYGKAIEMSIATYLLDNGKYPSSIDELTIEYSGNEVVCNKRVMNEDHSIYLSECSVGGKEVKDNKNKDGYYHYGTTVTYDEYKIGDEIIYNGIDFYVIKDSDEYTDYVTLLKAEPLYPEEIDFYGTDENGINHVNNIYSSPKPASGFGNSSVDGFTGYGGVAYYSSETCNDSDQSGCTTDYEKSEIKYIVDAWALNELKESDLKEDNLGYKVRLITYEELINNLGYAESDSSSIKPSTNGETPEWVYNDAIQWTMSSLNNSVKMITILRKTGSILKSMHPVYNPGLTVRPVINLYKRAELEKCENCF